MEVQRQGGGGLDDGAHAREAGDVGDFVQVGDDGDGSTRDDGAGVFGDPELGAFDVGVAVDEAGQQVGAAQVDGLAGAVAAAEAGDAALKDDDVELFDFGGEGVDDAAVGEEQVAGGVAASDGDELREAGLASRSPAPAGRVTTFPRRRGHRAGGGTSPRGRGRSRRASRRGR